MSSQELAPKEFFQGLEVVETVSSPPLNTQRFIKDDHLYWIGWANDGTIAIPIPRMIMYRHNRLVAFKLPE